MISFKPYEKRVAKRGARGAIQIIFDFFCQVKVSPAQFCALFSPDSAVAIDTKREEQPFRSKADGLLPLSR
jgi:hypothetical protein